MSVPTAEGLRRYPTTLGYHHDIAADEDVVLPDHFNPCTCTPACPPRCYGACGCLACALTFTIFADECGYMGEQPMTPEAEAEAIARYQGF